MEKHDSCADILQPLAATITRVGLREPVAFTLDLVKPLDFVNSQLALFVLPFTGGSKWGMYTRALTDEHGWTELRRLLANDKE